MREFILERNHTAVNIVEKCSVTRRHITDIAVDILEKNGLVVIFVGRGLQKNVHGNRIKFHTTRKRCHRSDINIKR